MQANQRDAGREAYEQVRKSLGVVILSGFTIFPIVVGVVYFLPHQVPTEGATPGSFDWLTGLIAAAGLPIAAVAYWRMFRPAALREGSDKLPGTIKPDGPEPATLAERLAHGYRMRSMVIMQLTDIPLLGALVGLVEHADWRVITGAIAFGLGLKIVASALVYTRAETLLAEAARG